MGEEILADREKRYNKILELIENFNLPVLCGKLNYPGNNKNTAEAKMGFDILIKLISDNYFSFLKHIEILSGFDGPSIIMVLNMNIQQAKRTSILLEETHRLGRIFDIDIYNTQGEPISRCELDYNFRGCLLCGDNAKICNKTTKHSLDELLNEINTRIRSYGEFNNGCC